MAREVVSLRASGGQLCVTRLFSLTCSRCVDTLARPFSQTLPRLHFSEAVVVARGKKEREKEGRWFLFKKRVEKNNVPRFGGKGRIGFGKEFNGSEMQCNPNMLRQAQLG